ncbi:MAG TPA: MarR family winged helix-turn-helix transcriptional regulator [Sphingobium sp.]|nr:MarR family winged helix-turn-helix transcriptional regulator [Sphingobium sp.]
MSDRPHTNSPPASDSARAETIDFERYVPTVVSRLATRLRVSANKFFGARFGLSLLDWRILSHLAGHGPSSAYDIWTSQSLEKSALSRALRSLEERDLVVVRSVKGAARRTTEISLTVEGHDRYMATFEEVERRHARLVAGLRPEQIEAFVEVVEHLYQRVPLMGVESEPFDLDLFPIRRSGE